MDPKENGGENENEVEGENNNIKDEDSCKKCEKGCKKKEKITVSERYTQLTTRFSLQLFIQRIAAEER